MEFPTHASHGEDEIAMELMKRLELLEEELKGIEEKIAGLEYFNQYLFAQERMANDEIQDAHNELIKEVLDENDSKLKELKIDLGEEVYEDVTISLNELNGYNPSASYLVQELWNSSSNRKASLKEAVESLLNDWKALKGN